MTRMARSTSRGASPILEIRAPLLRWYDANRRDLPWRRSNDPYAIWISEAMLQQTRVETVIPYWERFLEAFPDVESLARADLDDIYAVWTGLGYYSRARNLKHAAETIVAEHDGRLPETADRLRELKGIGRYTAGAIASIAFDREEPLVDGNDIRGMVWTNSYAAFAGWTSVSNGSAVQTGVIKDASGEPGTLRFLYPTLARGTIIMVR